MSMSPYSYLGVGFSEPGPETSICTLALAQGASLRAVSWVLPSLKLDTSAFAFWQEQLA